ncbi:hypothetical protein DI487_00020 [Flavobacterium sediminis]|uniref:Uncharacterized protein n=1 Tax=Flavobacterium sediminis TaxID=2201181 RepID=A0A2U8QQT9_9FLAO|nr:hypothetical protein [Flavobacterium sediminis]AWM12419.1 hypothetical protein DI487_00020 [Flavobacterium sediminis]
MKQIRTSKLSKLIAYYLAMMMFLQVTQPLQMYALTSGPSQPEFNAFTPIGTSDMVDLASGDFNYNIPIMDVGGYPINLAYNSGITMDQEASWVGLGWNLNVGQINRQMRGIPDDFNGDQMLYENNLKDNITVGANLGVNIDLFGGGESGEKGGNSGGDSSTSSGGSGSSGGSESGSSSNEATPITSPNQVGNVSFGLGVKFNNYDGVGFSVTGGLSYDISNSLSVGMQMESSVQDGVSASPTLSFSNKLKTKNSSTYNLGTSLGVSYNSRKGIESMTFSPSIKKGIHTKWTEDSKKLKGSNSVGIGATLSVNPDASYTPTKRVGMKSSNYMFNMDIDGAIWGAHTGIKFSGYRVKQGIDDAEKIKNEKAFGYQHTYNASERDVLDFNREKDRTINKNATVLPMTNYTYDIYSIQGQGVSGMFRPYKGQVGYVYDKYIEDKSSGGSLGGEFGVGTSQEWGFNGSVTRADSRTKLWGNTALSRFKEKKNNDPDYEKIFFKNVGGTHVDTELDLLNDKLGKYSAIKLSLAGSKFGRNTTQDYYKKSNGGNMSLIDFKGKVVRSERVNRGQPIQVLTLSEAKKFGYSRQFSQYARDHHTAEIRIVKEGGDQYVFGKALYNTIKKETTFDVSGREVDCSSGLVNYNPGSDNSVNNSRSGDQYFNRVTTPSYAHTFLLTEILSSDYQDIDGVKGPSDGDLGAYTKFVYQSFSDDPYKWRVPFGENKANYDEGLKSSSKDEKGNYIYGEKELAYIEKIETKTHIAIFELSERKDGYGVKGENGGLGTTSKSYKLNAIYLYSKPEYEALGNQATPIKVAHFMYDYDLCQGIENNNGGTTDNYEMANQGGKLTLKKVYFTYRDSRMGRYTPYFFSYQNNYDYNMKAYDVWGNYKPVGSNVSCKPFDDTKDMSNAEYPFVDQSDRASADNYATAWHLNSVKLPSGGTIEVNYESDDYAYVQNKEVMQMFKVMGIGNGQFNSSSISNNLFNTDYKYLYVNIPDGVTASEFKAKYLGDLIDEPVYFRFLLNMFDPNPLPGASTTDKYDYVTGYLKLANEMPLVGQLNGTGQNLAAIKIQTVNKGDGLNSNKQVNPISKAGWYFGRSYLNKLVYGITNEEDTNDLKSIVMELIATVPSIRQIFQSPNGRLEDKKIASRFIPNKSWIRLMQPDRRKVGGGSRVKEVQLHDEWDVMTGNTNDPVYAQFYGQQYSYVTENKGTSGVATYEPLGCKENPFVKPFYDKGNPGLLLGPDEQNYVEEPFGESFFPNPKITYSRVEVRNLPREKTVTENNETKTLMVKKHATGKVVTEFYTSFQYPTIVDYTPISFHYDKSPLASLIRINDKQHLTMSQGFSIHTNDMDGKMKSQRVYAEGQTGFISGVDYNYYDNTTTSIKENGLLNNEVVTIDRNGNVSNNVVGVDYDVINDFRENKSVSETTAIRFNTEGIPLPIIYLVVPIPLPSYSRHEELLKTAITTKSIHSTGILRETVAYDAGSVVSTNNLAWDAETGQVLLTETVNEYDDKYYSFNYPAYWAKNYNSMGQAAKNLDLQWGIELTGNGEYYTFVNNGTSTVNASNYLIPGDELWVTQNDDNGFSTPVYGDYPRPFKAWVYEVNSNGEILLIDKDGLRVDQYKVTNGRIKVVRSGYRNLQTASMASVTSMHNPLPVLVNGQGLLEQNLFETDSWDDYRIVNTAAIEYSDLWPGQCECNLPKIEIANGALTIDFPLIDYNDVSVDIDAIYENSYNPYVYNILGNWRAKKSYAFLTGRYHSEHVTPRVSGFYNDFSPFYILDANREWVRNEADLARWTFASEVTQYNPYGQEVENRDALNRYSSALYGYNYRFPLAVASNTKYTELGYDGFEDYDFSTCDSLSHFNFEGSLELHNIEVSESHSHTGRRSLRIAPSSDVEGRKALLRKKIITCDDASSTSNKQRKAVRTTTIK